MEHSRTPAYLTRVEFLAILVLGLFDLLVGWALLGWLLTRPSSPGSPAISGATISVIIPARNEARHLPDLLHDLSKQNYPDFEVIVVDDHSTDGTADVATTNAAAHVRVIRLTDTEGKKAALTAGILAATGASILTTDADCRVGPRWIGTMAAACTHDEPKMLLGPVAVNGTSVLALFQKLDTMILMLFTAAAVRWKRPVLANGANLMFARSDFVAVGGYGEHGQVSSGDDVLLMQRFAHHLGRDSIRFLKSREAIVTTHAEKTLAGFVAQRSRWLSKSRHMSASAGGLMVVAFALSAGLVLLSVALMSGSVPPEVLRSWAVLPFCAGTLVVAAMVMLSLAAFFQRIRDVLWMSILALFYPVYIIGMPLIALFVKPRWKGRPVAA